MKEPDYWTALEWRLSREIAATRRGTQEEWKFTLILKHRAGTRADIAWASLLPAESVTGWLTFDPSAKALRIEPSEAIPDSALPG